MSYNVYGMPGPGGSLGECALCGENFLLEVITSSKVRSIDVSGVKTKLYAHDRCIEKYAGDIQVSDLPPESPLRKAYERQQKKE